MLEFSLGVAFMLVVCLSLVLVLHKLGLLLNHGDVTNRFEAHREIVNGTLDLMRERSEAMLENWKQIFEARLKAELEPLRRDIEDARGGVMGLHRRLESLEVKMESLGLTSSLPGEGRQVPHDMEVVSGGAIGND